MTTIIATHEVEDMNRWLKAWERKPGSRHELMDSIGVKARVFVNDESNIAGLIFDVQDLNKFQALLQSELGKKAMTEDGVKIDTLRLAYEVQYP